MVECNANGLAGFYTTLKNVSIAALKFGKEWSVSIANWVVTSVKSLRKFIIQKYKDFFVRKDLSKQELENQIWIIKIATRFLTAFVFINILRVLARMVNIKK